MLRDVCCACNQSGKKNVIKNTILPPLQGGDCFFAFNPGRRSQARLPWAVFFQAFSLSEEMAAQVEQQLSIWNYNQAAPLADAALLRGCIWNNNQAALLRRCSADQPSLKLRRGRDAATGI
jgi:hypothetical protein